MVDNSQDVIADIEEFDAGLRKGTLFIDEKAAEIKFEFPAVAPSHEKVSRLLPDLIAHSLTNYRTSTGSDEEKLRLAKTCLKWINIARARNLVHHKESPTSK